MKTTKEIWSRVIKPTLTRKEYDHMIELGINVDRNEINISEDNHE